MGYSISRWFRCDAKGDPDRARSLVETLRQRTVDGLIMIGNYPANLAVVDRADQPAVIYVHGETDEPGDTVYLPDDHSGMHMVVDHLARTGRRRFLHVTGLNVYGRCDGGRLVCAPSSGGAARGWGGRWATAPGRSGGRVSPWPGCYANTRERGRDHLQVQDQIAAGVADAVLATGRKIPDDVALTGFDNWLVFAEEMQPGLTTVDMNVEQLGACSAESLMQAMNGAVIQLGITAARAR